MADNSMCQQEKKASDRSSYSQEKLRLLEWLLNWTMSSPRKLRAAERCLLGQLKVPFHGLYVDIGPVVGQSDQIWTLSVQAKHPELRQRVPLVALHDVGTGLAIWLLNLEDLAKERSVFAIDILGFGRSSRPLFSGDPASCERQLVEALEQWRREFKLRRMILLGHGLGAYLASCYALSYPQRVQHLVLADAWGFEERPTAELEALPLWVRLLGRVSQCCHPYWMLLATGPFNSWLVQSSAPALLHHFEPLLGPRLPQLTQYMHQCLAATPSGEAAFRTLSLHHAYAQLPLLPRIADLPQRLGMTFIYGAQSWLNAATGAQVKSLRRGATVDVIVIEGAGHHVHVEQAELFNRHVNAACLPADKLEPF